MPRDVFIDLLGARPSLQKIFELSRAFKTSLSATAIRCSELSQVPIFEVEGGNMTWSRGGVRRVETAFKSAIEKALAGKSVDEVVYLHNRIWSGEWRLEGAPIGRGSRALFLLQPIRSNGRPHTEEAAEPTLEKP